MTKTLKWLAAIVAILATTAFNSCNDNKSYAEQLNDERRACNAYLANYEVINDIPEDTVFQTGSDAPFYRIDKDGNSTFEIPITFDKEIAVSALTTAMSEPHLIDYTLYFDSSTLIKK